MKRLSVALLGLLALTGCTNAKRQALMDGSPSLRLVIAEGKDVSINLYSNGGWQVIDERGVCPDGGYGKTVEEAAKDCLAHPIPYLGAPLNYLTEQF